MDKVWYIKVESETEGPYSKHELRWDPRITLDTLAWKAGMPGWLPIREIPELADVVKEDEADNGPEDDKGKIPGKEGVLTLSPDPQFQVLLIVALAILILIILYFSVLS